MSEWITTFDAVFFLSIGTLFVGLIGTMLKYCIKSKCEEFSCCSMVQGCSLFTVKRRVDLEVQEELHEMDIHQNPTASNNNNNNNNSETIHRREE